MHKAGSVIAGVFAGSVLLICAFICSKTIFYVLGVGQVFASTAALIIFGVPLIFLTLYHQHKGQGWVSSVFAALWRGLFYLVVLVFCLLIWYNFSVLALDAGNGPGGYAGFEVLFLLPLTAVLGVLIWIINLILRKIFEMDPWLDKWCVRLSIIAVVFGIAILIFALWAG